MKTVTPQKMFEMLHSPCPGYTEGRIHSASLEMLRELYRQSLDDPKIRQAEIALKDALESWSNVQVYDFLINHLY